MSVLNRINWSYELLLVHELCIRGCEKPRGQMTDEEIAWWLSVKVPDGGDIGDDAPRIDDGGQQL
jgi:hypothetical protein